MSRCAQAGQVTWLGLRPARRADMVRVDSCEVTLAGLDGDRAKTGKRAVTLIQAEHLSAIGAFLGRTSVEPELLRRNIVVSGLNLSALKGCEVSIAGALVRITGICAPCSRMEETFGHGGYSAVRGHGGWCAEVLEPGRIALNDPVRPKV